MTDKIKLVKCYFLRVFAPHWLAPHHQGETQQETAGRLISFWPLLLGVVSFFFLFLATSGWVCAISIRWVSRFFRQLLSAPTTIMADYGGAYPRRSLFNLADLDSTPPVEELSLGLSSLTIVPSIDPSASSWTAGGMGGVAPISAATWASRGQRSCLSGRGGGIGVLQSYRPCL